MNNGKICVSVCAETADEFIENIKRAAEFADVVELRFDCLNGSEADKVLDGLKDLRETTGKLFLATYRPKEQGGKLELTQHERAEFFRYFEDHKTVDLIDVELDMAFFPEHKSAIPSIHSFHDFSGASKDLNKTYEKLSGNSEIIKIAVQTGDIADSIVVWKLLEKAKSENRKIVPIAMGEAGKWTRILGLAYGAFMTYAALDAGKETAEGQLTAKDLIETYGVKELDENTEIYGVIGGNTSYSVSPFMQNAAFKFYALNAVYIPFEVKDLAAFFKKFLNEVRLNFKGFSVTIPHKQAVIEFLDEIDETAKTIGAVNTVKIENGKLFGFNTDADGFIAPLKTAFGDLNGAKVAVFGAGGAARACVYGLKKENAKVTLFARDLKKAENLAEDFQVELKEFPKTNLNNFDILINTTPLGTKGALENETLLTTAQLEGVKFVFDLVYNPLETAFINEAKKANVAAIGGLEMLVAQGAKQFEIWTEKSAPIEEMRRAALLKLE